MSVQFIESAENALVKRLTKLKQQNNSYRKLGQVWLEGEHLCDSYAQLSLPVDTLVLNNQLNASMLRRYKHLAIKTVVLNAKLWKNISTLDIPAKVGFLVNIDGTNSIDKSLPSVVLDRVQDAGNVGTILRSAAAFGVKQVLAIKGTAALWSNKVLRAAMGAHFSLRLCESLTTQQLVSAQIPLLVASPHQGQYLHQIKPMPQGAWVLGHEGQGVSLELQQAATQLIRIYQPGGQESLNVAAAASICLYFSAIA